MILPADELPVSDDIDAIGKLCFLCVVGCSSCGAIDGAAPSIWRPSCEVCKSKSRADVDVDMEPSKKDNDDTWQDLNLQQLLDEPSTVSNSTGPNP